MYLQGFPPSRISAQLSVKATTINSWQLKGRWRALRDNRTLQAVRNNRGVDIVDRSDSLKLRSKLAETLQLHADALSLVTTRPNVEKLAQSASVIETLARSAKIVHDWGSGSASGIILIEELRKVEPVREAIEPACMLPATTPSVASQDPSLTEPLASQAIDVQADSEPAK